jgi:hypothetical protein
VPLAPLVPCRRGLELLNYGAGRTGRPTIRAWKRIARNREGAENDLELSSSGARLRAWSLSFPAGGNRELAVETAGASARKGTCWSGGTVPVSLPCETFARGLTTCHLFHTERSPRTLRQAARVRCVRVCVRVCVRACLLACLFPSFPRTERGAYRKVLHLRRPRWYGGTPELGKRWTVEGASARARERESRIDRGQQRAASAQRDVLAG